MSTWWNILSRKKRLSVEAITSDNQLARVLNTFDLTALGVGSTLGVGVYVLAGNVAKDTAGPSVVISFLIAAVASVFAGLCYAEFGARVPRAGSAYIYSYVCVGEFIAFIIGWNLILEYVIGSASVAKGLSLYLDSLMNNTMKNAFTTIAPINSSFMSEYFDFFSFGITLVLGAALAFGLKESTLANNIFTILNILVVLFVIIAGALNADPKNWSIPKQDIPANVTGGEGGFFPFGIEGTIKGAATCFYGFVGFDCIATTGEEVKNPQRAIPISIILSLFIIFLAYFGTSTVLTLMCPYYLQDPDAPIPHVFEVIGWDVAKWVVAIGGIFGLCASLFGAMFPLPRIIYAMASDALVFKFLGSVNSRFRTPVVGTLLAALLTGLMSAIFNLKQLVNMMSIGTLLAYTIVAACVIILRYSITEEELAEWKYSLLQTELDSDDEYTPNDLPNEEISHENLHLIAPAEDFTMRNMTKQMFNFKDRSPTYVTQKLVTLQVFLFSVLALVLALCASYLQPELEHGETKAVVPIVVIVLLMLVILVTIYAQPKAISNLSFSVPLVPIIPALSICINLYLMVMLDINTWIRFGVWMAFGIPIYFSSRLIYAKQKSPSPKKSSKNGIINYNYSFSSNTQNSPKTEKNHHKLTIPEIRIVRPSIVEHRTTEEMLQLESETRKTLKVDQKRSQSEDIAITNAVSVLDKVILESEDELQEAINPENEYKQYEESYSSDSGSENSEEHHVKAIIHQEDDNINITPKNEKKSRNEDSITNDLNHAEIIDINQNITKTSLTNEESSICINEDNLETTTNESPSLNIDEQDKPSLKFDDTVDKNTPEENRNEIPNEETLSNKQNVQLEESEDNNTPFEIEDAVPNEDTTKLQNENLNEAKPQIAIEEPELINEEFPTNEDLFSKKLDSETGEFFIPQPPPMPLINQHFIPILNISAPKPPISPRTKYQPSQPVIVTVENIGKVQLRPTPAQRLRTDSISSTGSLNNIKPGSTKFEKFKSQLSTMLKKREPLKVPDRRTWAEDLTPSPLPDEQIDFNLQFSQLEEIKDVPLNFGKTKEFKDNLNSLLQRKHSANKEKPEYVKNYAEKATPVTEEDVANHKKIMLGTLKSIILRRDGLKGIDPEYQDNSDNRDEENEGKNSKNPEKNDSGVEKRYKENGKELKTRSKKENQNEEKTESKKDSRKSVKQLFNQTQNADLVNEENVEKTNDDKERHKKRMVASLNSLKLRKTGINLNDDTTINSIAL